ncbi:sulfotransferase family 2 domain-containing protein [Halomonas sp. 25-S5]|uniref:sulfotransferase family 2 domain-containing protein n=1 Tax=Halomonas sp. 25-S5 TaxID=2994065 RepID=UPI0024685495|nr:sulfotransferase family 2 domain-containing protein [Halomonas sp. 25-S5]
MIISHKYRFIFIHCRKVAGSAIKTTLWPHLGPDDIMIGSLDEVLQRGGQLNRAARKAMRHPRALNVTRKAALERWQHGDTARYRNLVNTAVKARYRRSLFRNPVHPPAESAKAMFPHEWENYFKFCFVRNPYEQALSEYSHQKRNSGREFDFVYFLKALSGEIEDRDIMPSGLTSNWPLYTINDQVAVDHVGRYENLEEDFAWLCEQLGIHYQGRLHEEKVEKHRRTKKLHDWYDEGSVERVHKLYSKEVEYFSVPSPVDEKPME